MTPGSKSPGLLIAVMFIANVGGMTAMVSFPTLVSTFQVLWHLNNTEAGWISGIYFAGYVLAVPLLTGLTDRIDARKIIIASMLLGILATTAFALWASGFWTATLWRLLQGMSFAGIYMPSIKALSEALPEPNRNRGTAFLTSSYAMGASLSFFASGQLNSLFGWQSSFLLLALGPLLGLCLTALFLPPGRPPSNRQSMLSLDFRAIFSNKPALAYMIAYGVHNGEASIMRSWIVAYLMFAQVGAMADGVTPSWSAADIAAIASLLGVAATVLVAELIPRFGRKSVISLTMITSSILGIALALSLWTSYSVSVVIVLIYAAATAADSGAINGGIILRAKAAIKGQTLAMHALFAASAAFLLPVFFGMVLDLAGGADSRVAWTCAFIAVAAFVLIGPIALYILDRANK